MTSFFKIAPIAALTLGSACARGHQIGAAPELSSISQSAEYLAMTSPDLPVSLDDTPTSPTDAASLWSQNRSSLLGERRAAEPGDILTVVIEINDKAEISNSAASSRKGSEYMTIGALFGLPEAAAGALPAGASLDPGVAISSNSDSAGQGSVRRNEKLTLRIAATVVGVLPNGVLQIEGRQEIRVNFEVRELVITGFVRPEDISRQNQITYDKIASARISYGGRGQISDMQQPRYGQQIADRIFPF